jgi:hypothetical protein
MRYSYFSQHYKSHISNLIFIQMINNTYKAVYTVTRNFVDTFIFSCVKYFKRFWRIEKSTSSADHAYIRR